MNDPQSVVNKTDNTGSEGESPRKTFHLPAWKGGVKPQFLQKLPAIPPVIKNTIILVIVIMCGGIPPSLVIANNWFGILDRGVLNPVWCRSSFFCSSLLPSYFLIVFICCGILLVLFYFLHRRPEVVLELLLETSQAQPVSKKQALAGMIYLIAAAAGFIGLVIYSLMYWSIPGWNLVLIWLVFMLGCLLWAMPLEQIQEIWKKNSALYLAMLVMHVATVALMYGLFGNTEVVWFTVILGLLALANLWRYRHQVPMIFWIVTLALVVFSINLGSWWTAAVGDEYSFMTVAKYIMSLGSPGPVGELLFNANGAQGTHTCFSSILQVISMLIFGGNNFGWRFSNPYMCALSVGLFYLFCRTFIPKNHALMSAFLLAVSSCLMSFSKIGYNNLQALFAMALLLATAAWALRQANLLTYAILGSELAFCFYIYPAALYVIPLPLLLLAMYDFPRTRDKRLLWVAMLLTAAALIFPLMMQSSYWETKIPGTFYNQPEITRSFQSFIEHIVSNLFYASFTFLFIVEESHFVASSYLDPVTGGLFIIGCGLMVYQARRHKFTLFILLSYVFFILAIGASHDRTHPPNTRMFLFLPLYSLIAAWGVFWIKEQAGLLLTPKGRQPLFLTGLFVISLTGLNLFQGYGLSHYRYAHQQVFESLFLRVAQRVNAAEHNKTKTFTVIVDKTWCVDGLLLMQEVYPELAYVLINQIVLDKPVIPEEFDMMVKDRNTVVFFFSGMDKSWFQPLDEQLRKMGKEPCEITTVTGIRRFTLYHAPDLPQACYP